MDPGYGEEPYGNYEQAHDSDEEYDDYDSDEAT